MSPFPRGSAGGPDVGPASAPRAARGPARAAWRWGTDPLVPALLLAPAAVLAAARAPQLTWAVIGGLAGYSLSGSV